MSFVPLPRRLLLFLALLLIGIAWGGSVMLAQVAVRSGLSPFAVTIWELAWSLPFLAAGCAATGRWPLWSRRWLVLYLAVGAFGTLMPNTFSYWAAAHVTGGIISLTIATAPMITLVLAVLLGTDVATRARLVGLALGATAIALLVLPGEALPEGAAVAFVFVALLAPVCYAVETNTVARFVPPDADPLALLLGATLAMLAIGAPFMMLTGQGSTAPAPWNMGTWGESEWALLGLTVLHVTAYSGYLRIVQVAGPVFASQVGTVVTVSGVLLSVWFLGERNTPFVWTALVLLLAGLALVRPREDDDVVRAEAVTRP